MATSGPTKRCPKASLRPEEIALLGRALDAEMRSAFQLGPCLIQSRSAASRRLVESGLLQRVTETLPDARFPVVLVGLALTEAGRLAYCRACDVEPD